MATIAIRKSIRISAAHQLPLHPGKCKFLHGHNYLVEAWCYSDDIDEETGMVVDFDELADALKQVVGFHDHTFLNDSYGDMPTTAENLAMIWQYQLSEINPGILRVRVWETEDSYAEYDSRDFGDF